MAGEDPVGMRQKLADLVRDRGLSDRVQLLDRVPQRRVAELHQEADIFVFPSWHESQGLAALEAAASGIPIIGSNVGIVSDLAPHRAVAIEPGNAGELAESILRLWDDQDLVNSMKQNGRSWVDRFATPEASAHRFIDQYRRLTSAYR